MVSTSNLKSVMDNLGIKLKDSEFKDLVQSLPVGGEWGFQASYYIGRVLF